MSLAVRLGAVQFTAGAVATASSLLLTAHVARAAIILPADLTPAIVNAAARLSGFPQSDFPYVESPNGCGADGWTQTAVRDRWGKVNFTEVCNRHDRCFMTLGKKRLDCDGQFAKELESTCYAQAYIKVFGRKVPDPAQYPFCATVAASYSATVFAVSGNWFYGPNGSQARQARFETWVKSWLAARKPRVLADASSRGTARITPRAAAYALESRERDVTLLVPQHGARMTLDAMLYMVSSFARTHTGRIPQPVDGRVSVPCDGVDGDVEARLTDASRASTYSDVYRHLRALLIATDGTGTGHYNAAHGTRHDGAFPLPRTVAELADTTGFNLGSEAGWDKHVIPLSAAKNRTRVLFRSARMSIAQTLETDDGDESAPVRETELAVARDDSSGQWDFYAYGADGHLSLSSTFASATGKDISAPVPLTCMGCHYDGASRAFQRLPLSYAGQ